MMRITSIAVACGLLGAAVSAGADDAEYKVRDIVRAGIDKDGRVRGRLAKLTGIANATSLTYKVILLEEKGTERQVDEAEYVFRPGQKFRLAVEADTDLYLYVFNQNAKGVRTVLMPDASDQGRVPMVRKGKTKIIPDDGTYFEFVPPIGVDRLMIYATKEKAPELTEDVIRGKANEKARVRFKSKQDRIFEKAKPKATRKVDSKQVAEASDRDEVVKFSFRGITSGIAFLDGTGTTVIRGADAKKDKPSLFVEIALKTKR